eukprot:TRINITY_DN36_c5_g1_i1.p1 TRINITY_DN36_c5_g1~~TRINITY_DN36_c5_g1_i1.p1  ORF type:complete len:315 (+),score=61.06 TRINITY_DN36_c5_g1_i1:81-1025(+)
MIDKRVIAALLGGIAITILLKQSSREIDEGRASELKGLMKFKKEENEVDDAPRIKIKACLNDATVAHKITLWTMLIPQGEKRGYVDAAKKLLKSAKRHSNVEFDAMLLELKEKPLTDDMKDELKAEGWGICVVNRLPPPDEEATFKHFRDQFTKFALWEMAELDTILYLDADTYIVGDITPLLTTKLEGKKMGAGRDFMKNRGGWVDTFNMGVFLIHPNTADYNELITYHRGDRPLEYNKHWSEQAFLNALWKDKWYDLGFEHNANLALYTEDPAFWKSRQNHIRVVHYTMRKPWKNCQKSPYYEICKWWLEER